ncbi:transposase family protein [Anthocerotibacter panamensis]|uniref:transposase family protein n=1 Tax=Anthocerotibacter panamensis TaxID=2857077 RepID=UPI001C40499C|nr:transposase family protein [Anthocerotibacter panamensis]
MNHLAMLDAFADFDDVRRKQGTRHSLSVCLALFTLAVAAGNKGFNAMGDGSIPVLQMSIYT